MLLGEITQCLAIVLPCLAHCPVFDGAPVGIFESLIALKSDLNPCDIVHALVNDVSSSIDPIRAIHHFTPTLIGFIAPDGLKVVMSVIVAFPPALALKIPVGIATEPYCSPHPGALPLPSLSMSMNLG